MWERWDGIRVTRTTSLRAGRAQGRIETYAGEPYPDALHSIHFILRDSPLPHPSHPLPRTSPWKGPFFPLPLRPGSTCPHRPGRSRSDLDLDFGIGWGVHSR
jgi:hypothetical protein